MISVADLPGPTTAVLRPAARRRIAFVPRFRKAITIWPPVALARFGAIDASRQVIVNADTVAESPDGRAVAANDPASASAASSRATSAVRLPFRISRTCSSLVVSARRLRRPPY